MKKVFGYFKNLFLSKTISFYLSLGCAVLLLIQVFVYPSVPQDLFSNKVVVVSLIGSLAFVILNLHNFTTKISHVAIFVCSFLSIIFFVQSDGFIDYFSTQFFGGFSFAILFSLPGAIVYTFIASLLGFIISSVAFYLPQERVKAIDKEIKEGEIKDEK